MPSSTNKPTPTPPSAWLEDTDALLGIGLAESVATEAQGRVGPYRLIEKLGEGGLGVVWRAEQSAPIQREVALKLIKPGLHYRAEVITRFDLERQALARMNHPNIAAILDAGTLDDERPYFVMELVHGAPLTRYCTRQNLGVRAKLELFITICQAVHHAHQKGILHRDLKPSNILVTTQDGQPLPKIIDFGIAKALDQTDAVMNNLLFQTQVGDLPCATYQYMSPEQASRGALDIDTRSDIYTLGVILYELLTGKLPLPDDLARGNNFDAIAAHVREIDPPRPSVRVTSLNNDTRTGNALRGDLDWIVLRALEKNRERRYESAAALAADIQLHLAHEPVSAGPPSTLYRCGKWVRRHRVTFAAASAVSLSLCVGLVMTSLALSRERQALEQANAERQKADASRELAVQREREAVSARELENKARQAAEASREQALASREQAIASRKVADAARDRAEQLINDTVFDLRDKLEPIGRLPLLEQVAQSAAQYFESIPASDDSDAQQRNRSATLQNHGSVLLAKGDAVGALKAFEASLEIARQRVSIQPSELRRLDDLAIAFERVGSAHEGLGNFKEAQVCYDEMQRVYEYLESSGAPSARAWQLHQATAKERMGDLAKRQGDVDAAKIAFESAREQVGKLDATVTGRNKQLAVLEEKLGDVHVANGNMAEALACYGRELVILESLGKQDLGNTTMQAMVAIAHGKLASSTGDAGEALKHARAQVDVFEKLTAHDPLNSIWQRQAGVAQQQLGVALELSAKADEAINAYRQAISRLQTARSGDADAARALGASRLCLAATLLRRGDAENSRIEATAARAVLSGLPQDAEVKNWQRTAEELAK